jgi:hypothetical protein
MGYRGSSNYDERDKLFQRSERDKPVNNPQVKKDLESLFKAKPVVDPCLKGHAWIRDWDRQYKCARCKTPKPTPESPLK